MIEIFGKGQCAYCSKSIALAKSYGLEYEYYDITYKKYRDDLESRITLKDVNACPFIFWNRKYVGSYPEFAEECENTIGGYGDQPC